MPTLSLFCFHDVGPTVYRLKHINILLNIIAAKDFKRLQLLEICKCYEFPLERGNVYFILALGLDMKRGERSRSFSFVTSGLNNNFLQNIAYILAFFMQ